MKIKTTTACLSLLTLAIITGSAKLQSNYDEEMMIDRALNALKKSNKEDRVHALSYLYGVSFANSEAVKKKKPEMFRMALDLSNDHDVEIRLGAVMVLGVNGNPKAIPRFLDVLKKDQNDDVCAEAIIGLANLAEDAEIAVPALISALDRSGEEQKAASLALALIGESCVPPLCEVLSNQKNKHTKRYWALRSLMTLREKAKTAVPTLIGALKDRNKDIRHDVVYTLEAIGLPSPELVFALQGALHDCDRINRGAAAIALLKIDPDNALATQCLLKIVKGDDDTQEYVIHALSRVEKEAGTHIALVSFAQ